MSYKDISDDFVVNSRSPVLAIMSATITLTRFQLCYVIYSQLTLAFTDGAARPCLSIQYQLNLRVAPDTPQGIDLVRFSPFALLFTPFRVLIFISSMLTRPPASRCT